MTNTVRSTEQVDATASSNTIIEVVSSLWSATKAFPALEEEERIFEDGLCPARGLVSVWEIAAAGER